MGGLLVGLALLAFGAFMLLGARATRASYVQLYANGFAVMRGGITTAEATPREIVRWDDITDVSQQIKTTVTNGITTDKKYTCSMFVGQKQAGVAPKVVELTSKDFKNARSLGQEILLEHARRS